MSEWKRILESEKVRDGGDGKAWALSGSIVGERQYQLLRLLSQLNAENWVVDVPEINSDWNEF